MDIEQTASPAFHDGLDRDAAMTRSKTVLPVSKTVEAEAVPDEQVAAQHVTMGALANIETDAECTQADSSTTFASPSRGHLPVIGLVSGIAIAMSAGIIAFLANN